MNREQRLAETFVELADSLVDGFDVVDLMVLLTERCVELLDAAAAGLLLADNRGRLRLVAATDEASEAAEALELQDEQGPAQECFRTGRPVLAPDLRADAGRWPRFASVATGGGFRSASALPLRLRDQVLGALSLFRAEPADLGAADLAVAQALADVATIALVQSRIVDDARLVAEQLEHALHSRIAIEQAKGVIAERVGCDVTEAFALLRDYARSHQARLSLAASQVVDGSLRPEALARRA